MKRATLGTAVRSGLLSSLRAAFRRGVLSRSLAIIIAALALSACSRHYGTAQVCEPPGSTIEKPGGGLPRFHAVDAPPERLDDGWSVSTLQAVGLDPGPIGELLRASGSGDFAKLDGVLIARNGKLVLEAYFNGFHRDARHNIKSAFKSITSALAGIAIDRGLIAGVDQPISLYFPDYWPRIKDGIDQKRRVTLEHLLTMTPGFSRSTGLDESEDWYEFALNQPMAEEPGTEYAYSDANSILVGGIIAQAAENSVIEFANRHLFHPLGITRYCWTLTAKGQAMTDGSFYMRPRDMLKFGQLYLDRGVWRGRRIVSAAWVTHSTSNLLEFGRIASERWVTQSATAKSAASSPYPGWTMLSRRGYGYYWWNVAAQPGEDSRFDVYYANGDGGQKIFILPNLDMVVVVTGSHYGRPEGSEQSWGVMHRFILPAVLD